MLAQSPGLADEDWCTEGTQKNRIIIMMLLIILYKSLINIKRSELGEETENRDAKTKTIHESMSGGAQSERRFAG